MKDKNTPWKVIESNFYGKNYIVEDSNGNTLAAFSDKSTAELVASAPELRKMLEAVIDQISSPDYEGGISLKTFEEIQSFLSKSVQQ